MYIKYINTSLQPPACHVAIYSWLSACPVEIEPFKDHSKIPRHLWMSNKTQTQATVKAAWATSSTEILVIQSDTYTHRYTHTYTHIYMHVYIIYVYYDEVIHQRNSKVYMYMYTHIHLRRLVCIIYTSGV